MSAPNDSPQLLLDRRYDDLDALRETIHGWGLDFVQIERGSFSGELRQWQCGALVLAHGRFRRQLAQEGTTPPRALTFSLPASRNVEYRWRGAPATSDRILVAPEDRSFDGKSSAAFDVYTVTIPEHEHQRLNAATGGLIEAITELYGRRLRCDPDLMRVLRRAIRRTELTTLGRDAHDGTTIPALIMETMRDAAAGGGETLRRSGRRRALRAAVRYMETHYQRSIRTWDLCRHTGASERTLQYAFQAEYGVSPMEFLSFLRLHLARRSLIRSRPTSGAVGRIARECGFKHPGRFSIDYRAMFGESPASTLRAT